MTLTRLLWRNLRFHWRGNAAVFLGVAVGTAVLTGALLVGDSLRGSLRDLALRQLGWVHQALLSGRFFREELANSLLVNETSPALVLQGSAASGTGKSGNRAGKVVILGVDERFWQAGGITPPVGGAFWNSADDGVVINSALAADLGVVRGDTVTVVLQKASSVPRESLLGRRDASEVVDEIVVPVAEVLPADSLGGRFSLAPSTVTPRNAFLPLHALQKRVGVPGRVNALLVGNAAGGLTQALAPLLTLDDWGLVLHDPESRTADLFAKLDRNKDGRLQRTEWRGRVPESFVDAGDRDHDGMLTRAEVADYFRREHPYLSLESRQMLLEPAAASAAPQAARDCGLRSAPTLVYLSNTIAHGGEEIPYSIIAALDASLPSPLGPFLAPGGEGSNLKDNEIVLADWQESPLHAKPGEQITLKCFPPEEHDRFKELTATFRLRGSVPIRGAADDPDLTPEFPGITDKLDIRDWNPPFPYDNKRVKKRDEDYWRKYRTTPKAYVTLAAGQRLWGSRFGQLTSVRLAPEKGQDLSRAADDFRRALLAHLQPDQGGFVFQPIREEALKASTNGTDFGGLFLGFSSFLILAALLLVGLLFRLNLDRRASEVGLLLATGYRRTTVRRLMLLEGCVLAALGALVGCVGALVFAWLMLEYLFPLSFDRSFLTLHVSAGSFLIGYFASVAVSVLTIVWAVRILGKVAPSALLAGVVTPEQEATAKDKPKRWSLRFAIGSLMLGLAIIIWTALDPRLARDHETLASMFFSGGALLLTAGLLLVWSWMRSPRAAVRAERTIQPSQVVLKPLTQLGVRNAKRHPLRSLLTAGLLASAAFILVAVDSFRRTPAHNGTGKDSSDGGFILVGESNLPVYQDLNTDRGRNELNFTDSARQQLAGVSIYQLRIRRGDDASCLNLYEPRRPRLLGIPHPLIERGGFQFQSTLAKTADAQADPWRLLEEPHDDGAVPVFGEANSVMWILKSGLGKDIAVTNGRGESVKLRVVGLLQDSVFQSELLMSEANFLKLFPDQEGYNYFLIDGPPERARPIQSSLTAALADRGFEATPSAERLAGYLAVENAYLSTFQALGGLGLLLGALGLAVVLLRNVWERRSELALLRALGYRNGALGWLILAENGFLLMVGLGIGTAAALLSVAPRLVETGGNVPVLRLLVLLAVVLVVGLAAGAAAVVTTLRAPLLPALRRE